MATSGMTAEEKEQEIALERLKAGLQKGYIPEREAYVSAGIDGESVMEILDTSLCAGDHDRLEVCLNFISTNTLEVIHSVGFISASVQAMHKFLEVDVMAVREVLIWRNVLSWAVMTAQVATDDPRFWTDAERECILPLLQGVLKPGRLRVLDIEPEVYAEEIESTKAVDEEELIFKYRFDALKSEMTFMMNDERKAIAKMWRTHYSGKDDIRSYTKREAMKRLRRQAMIFESEHPHMANVHGETYLVEMPSWVQCILVEFDRRTQLAEDATLVIEYEGDAGKVTHLTFDERSGHRMLKKPLLVPSSKLELLFSSGCSPSEWGYRIRFNAGPLA